MRALAATRDNVEQTKRRRALIVFVYLMVIAVAASVSAQRPPSKKKDEKPKPRKVSLTTKDGVQLQAFYFPSDKGKEATTVLLVHEWQGQASPYGKLVLSLRDAGCAVLVPDYRGHGGSNEYNSPRGKKKFNIAQMSKRDVENIVYYDLEKSKAFLKEENNKGNLNLNALVVIGVREGCVMAARWASRDWSFPSVGRMKQGQDVKALVLISPRKQIKGVGIDPTLKDANLMRLPIMILAGSDGPDASEARKLAKNIEGLKRRIGRGEADGFELKMVDTTLSGPGLVTESSRVIPTITNFVKSHVDATEENPWVERD